MASVTSVPGDPQTRPSPERDPYAEALRLGAPDTWAAIVDRASKQRTLFPDGMAEVGEPAYHFVPLGDGAR